MSVHPFETVSINRLSQAHPRFWSRINMASVRAEIDRLKWDRELGGNAKAEAAK